MAEKITSALRADHPYLFLDNLSHYLDSPALAAVLTTQSWCDRLLGHNDLLTLPVRVVFVATGNNVSLSLELARRTIPIRLNPKLEQPWKREGFRHPKLLEWAAAHRPNLIWSALVLTQSWLAAGQPTSKHITALGSYEGWSQTIGGILAHAGIPGFLRNLSRIYDAADVESTAWREFIGAWWQEHGSRDVGIAELYPLAVSIEGLPLGKADSERGQKTALGRALRKKIDCVMNGYQITDAGFHRNAAQWKLIPVGAEAGTKTDPEGRAGEGECDWRGEV